MAGFFFEMEFFAFQQYKPCHPSPPFFFKLAIKNFNNKQNPVDVLEKIQTHNLDANSCDGPVKAEGDAGIAPLRKREVHRSHTISVALSTADSSDFYSLPRDASAASTDSCPED